MANLPIKGNGRLVEPLLLGVSDVRRDNSIKRQTTILTLLLEYNAIFLCLYCQLTAHGILHVANGRIERIDSKRAHGSSCPRMCRWKKGR